LRGLVTFELEDPAADVLVVTSGWPDPDNETYCVFIKRQVESLVERGLHCDVLFIRGYLSRLAYVLGAVRLAGWSISGRRRYRLVHAHGGEAALPATFFRRAPLLVSYMGDDLLGTPRPDGRVGLRSRLRRSLFRQHARLATRTITKSLEMQDALPSSVQERNTVLPNGVDTRLFHPVERSVARRELGWDAEAPVVLFAADPAVARKRFWLAEEAVATARQQVRQLQLHVAAGVSPDLIPTLMNAADCLILTSSIEGSPNVVKEALMCDLPVVATDVGDVADLLRGVEPSYVCPPKKDSLSCALIRCVQERARSNGRQLSTRLDARAVADELLGIYRSIAPISVRRAAGPGREVRPTPESAET